MSQPFINSLIIGVMLIAGIVAFAMLWSTWQNLSRQNGELVKKNAALTSRLDMVEITQAVQARAIIPLSANVLSGWVTKLTHAHTPELDELMKLIGPPSTMSPEQRVRFTTLLNERVVNFSDPEIDAEERRIAAMLPFLIEQVDHDYAAFRRFTVPLTFDMSTSATPGGTHAAVEKKQRFEAEGAGHDG